tara:strand:- start:1074 stop:1343 length:270 start_codon:yes stop_codon:yes gene_type:complete
MLEGEYLEMVAQLKEKYDEITSKLDRIELLEIELKKDFTTAYGVVRLLDHLISNSLVGYDNEIIVIVEVLRGLLSDCMDKHILEIPSAN